MGSTVPYLMLLAVLASMSFALPAPKDTVYPETNELETKVAAASQDKGIQDTSEPSVGIVRESRAISDYSCLSHLYVLAFTSGTQDGWTDDGNGHSVELSTYRETRSVRLYNRPGNDYYAHKGDLWKIRISDFHFNDGCVRIPELRGIALTEHSDDGWHIESIVTFVRSGSNYQLYSEDFEANHWIDGDRHYSHRRFDLNVQV